MSFQDLYIPMSRFKSYLNFLKWHNIYNEKTHITHVVTCCKIKLLSIKLQQQIQIIYFKLWKWILYYLSYSLNRMVQDSVGKGKLPTVKRTLSGYKQSQPHWKLLCVAFEPFSIWIPKYTWRFLGLQFLFQQAESTGESQQSTMTDHVLKHHI